MLDVASPFGRQVPRYYVGPHDRITIDGLEYSHVETDKVGHVLCRVDNLKLVETIPHEDFWVLLKAPKFVLDRNWFSPEKARVRMHAGVASMRDLRDEEQAKILLKEQWCKAFLRLEATDPSVMRSDPKMEAAIARISPSINETANIQAFGRKRRRALAEDKDLRKPNPKTLRTWINLLLLAGGDPLILRDNYRKCGNRKSRLTPAEYALLVKHAWRFVVPTRPDKAQVYRDMVAEFDVVNVARRKQNLPELTVPSADRLNREIDALPKFKVHAGRFGVDTARAKYQPVLGGADVVRPLQRMEMDMWSVQLHVLCIDAGLWASMSPEMRNTVARTRKLLCVAIDCATRCILAMRFADEKDAENSQTALDTLQMAMSEKAPFVEAAGAVVPWDMEGTPETIATDNGPAFVAAAFKSAAHDAGISDIVPPAKLPHLRGTIERVFRTAHGQLAAMFEGRSFEDVVAKGDYPAVQRASITVDELAWALVRYVVDIYHNTEHDGLGGEMPRAAWLRLTSTYPVVPPPDVHKRRAAFGIELTRTVTPRGIRAFGIHYQAPELQKFLQERGFGTKIQVRVDEGNLGQISARLGDAWVTVDAPDETFSGLDTDCWLAAIRELRRRNARMAALTRPIVLDAIRAIQRLSDHAAKRANIASQKMKAEQIDREERKLAIGFEYVHPETPVKAGSDLYDGTLKVGAPAARRGTSAAAEQASHTDGRSSPARDRGRRPDGSDGWKIEEN